MTRATIIGTGLIGASVGMALTHEGWDVTGWDPDRDALLKALERHAIGRIAESPNDAAGDADLVFLCGPLQANIDTLAQIETEALLTDTTSVKVPFAEVGAKRFIGGHPMAGREHAGPAAASPALFRGATWVICPGDSDDSDVHFLTGAIESMGANPLVMTARRHDELVAVVSHLPHLIANALVNVAANDVGASDLVSGSFRDLTRVAAAESAWWPEVLAANAGPIGDALDRLTSELTQLRALASAGNQKSLESQLTAARDHRRAMAPPVSRVRVVLQDRPGEIASVGHALEASKADVRDLQLRHALHGGGGVLTLSVRPGEETALRSALTREGFETESSET